jgi:predicted metal-dependent peptidase
MLDQETRLKRNHIMLMKNRETSWYSGIMMMGVSEVSDKEFTAYTDGVNKKYSRPFMSKIKDDAKLRGLIMHENLHVALKHIQRCGDLFKENAKLANVSADFVVNDIIENFTDKANCVLPDGALYHPMFHNWSVREVYMYLKQKQKGGGGGGGKGQGGKGGKGDDEDNDSSGGDKVTDLDKLMDNLDTTDSLDEHDWESAKELTPEEMKKLEEGIDSALWQGGILAGRMGAKVPRSISDLLEPKVDWKDVLRDFVSSATKGKDEFTWRKFNKRMLANDIYMPSLENESVGEVVIGNDTSGSITDEILGRFASELASICDTCSPDKVRVLWWDTAVHGEQVFSQNYTDIAKMLKPMGGGGTYASCVSEYLIKHNVKAECVIMFTDGYVESDVKWDITIPTLWVVTQNKNFEPPFGKKIFMEEF